MCLFIASILSIHPTGKAVCSVIRFVTLKLVTPVGITTYGWRECMTRGFETSGGNPFQWPKLDKNN
jgi:hypothetical protein